MDGLGNLRIEHMRIVSMADEIAAMINQEEPPKVGLFRQLRRDFAMALTVHLNREDWVFYPRLLAHERPEVRELAAGLAAEADTFSLAFRLYNRRWTTVSIAADWLGFRKETLAVLAQLKHRVHVEDHELYPLVDDAGDDQGRRIVSLKPASGQPRRVTAQYDLANIELGLK